MDQLLALAADPSAWLALVTLAVMEIVLGVDNLVFVALLSSRLPPKEVTAVGMIEHIPIMIGAVIIAVMLMLLASGPLANFIRRNPTIVMLALGFSSVDRCNINCRRIWFSFPKRLHLRGDGVFRYG
jgi:predicted tellurium resistance membrane protein TerC